MITKAIDAGELFVAEIDSRTVATLQLQWSDPRFWGDIDADADAGYVHRLAVRRTDAGHGLGARLLDWADQQIRARDRSWLRIDVVSGNAPLRRYYESVRFLYRHDVEGEGQAQFHGGKDRTRRRNRRGQGDAGICQSRGKCCPAFT